MACRGVSEVREPNLARSGAGKLRSLHRRLADISQRINLVSHTARTTGFTPVYDISEPFAAVGAPRDTALSRLNSELVDVGFVDEAIQCDPEVCAEIGDTYKFAGRKDWDQGNQWVPHSGRYVTLNSQLGINTCWTLVSLQ